MASFLQNNGDILLDAVLTDYGRKLLAKGDGSFSIVKFALGDDEIDYGLFDTSVETMLQDKQIMDTPILEAFTNNAASMKNQLLTLGMQNILYLPILKVNTQLTPYYPTDYFQGFIVPVDSTLNKTTDALSTLNMAGKTVPRVGTLTPNNHLLIDQGLDSDKLDQSKNLKSTNAALYESAYNVYIDSRFGYISDNNGNTLIPLSTDDDGISVYKFTEQSTAPVPNINHVTEIKYDENNSSNQIILGTQGSRLKIGIIPSNNLMSDTYFIKYGNSDVQLNSIQPSKEFMVLRSVIRVVGVTTGYSLEIPILYAKVQN